MEKQGLLMRCYQNGNRKTRYVYLSDRGRELAAAVVDCFYAVERLAFTDVPEADRAVFIVNVPTPPPKDAGAPDGSGETFTV